MLNEFKNIKKLNVNNNIDDKNLIETINNNYDIDTFYCALLNNHFSFFYNQDYRDSDECHMFHTWLNNKIDKNELITLNNNEMIKNIFIFISKKKVENDYNNFFTYNKLLCLLIAARYVLATLSFKNNNGLYYQLLTNVGPDHTITCTVSELMLTVGDTQQLEVSAYGTPTYTSSNANKVSVSDEGLVTALEATDEAT